MANYVILGVEGDPTVYLVDLAQRTVASVDPETLDVARSGEGQVTIRGIDFAIAAGRTDAASLAFSPASKADAISGIDLAVAARGRTDAASLAFSPASKADTISGIDLAVAARGRTDAASLAFSPASRADAISGVDLAVAARGRTDAASLAFSPAS